MAGKMIQSIMHVAPHKGEFGIRIRLTRITQGVWMGEGWHGPSNAKNAREAGAIATPDGWLWPTEQEAEGYITKLTEPAHSFGYEKKL